MRVIKRDGRAVDYDENKIRVAILKANNDVRKVERATEDDIQSIIEYIEEFGKKRMLVEDIQDIIEQKLMEKGKYELAKKYIVYRYTRTLVRKQNTTDESILGLIRRTNRELIKENLNKSAIIASTQRDLIAGEVSKDLTKRILLPEKITKAHEEGILYFHDSEYFLQPIFNSCLINISDMLDNGTVINGKMIETPESFQTACIVMTQILVNIASNQYGEQYVSLKSLGKYLRKSQEKFEKEIREKYSSILPQKVIQDIVKTRLQSELKSGVKIIQYQINTLITVNGHSPNITLFLQLEDDEYIQENAMIIEEILIQTYKGVKDENGLYVTPEFPKLIYFLSEQDCLNGAKYDYLTKLAIKCSVERKNVKYISINELKENYEKNVLCLMDGQEFVLPWKAKNGTDKNETDKFETDKNGVYKNEGRFNQGVVSINLSQIGIISGKDESKFWSILDERLELCKEALLCRHYALLGTTSDISPIHWQYGGIARLEKGEKIDKYLKSKYSTLSLGLVGLYELVRCMKGDFYATSEGYDFGIRVIKYLKDVVEEWKRESGLGFFICVISSEDLRSRFVSIDKERFGVIKSVTDKEFYMDFSDFF